MLYGTAPEKATDGMPKDEKTEVGRRACSDAEDGRPNATNAEGEDYG